MSLHVSTSQADDHGANSTAVLGDCQGNPDPLQLAQDMQISPWTDVPRDSPSPPLPRHGGIVVWRVGLERSAGELERCLAVLSADEVAAADRYHFAQHRDAYVLSRGSLRLLLASYLGAGAGDIQFAYGEYGKPRISTPEGADVHFNLSHSGNVAMIAVGRAPIGVDVEKEREVRCLEDVARRFFTPAEAAVVVDLPVGRRRAAFFRCWTRKEAVIKALGKSIAHLSATLDVMHLPTGPLSGPGGDGGPEELYLADIPVDTGWQAACCLSESIRDIRLHVLL